MQIELKWNLWGIAQLEQAKHLDSNKIQSDQI